MNNNDENVSNNQENNMTDYNKNNGADDVKFGLFLTTTDGADKVEVEPQNMVWYLHDVSDRKVSPLEKDNYLKINRDGLKGDVEPGQHNGVLCNVYRELKKNTKKIRKGKAGEEPQYGAIDSLILTDEKSADEKHYISLEPFVKWIKSPINRRISNEEKLGCLGIAEREVEKAGSNDSKTIERIYGNIEKNRKKLKKKGR